MPPVFAGRDWTRLLEDLPPGTDPCGENGEFHTCVYAGPMFAKPIALVPGDVEQDGDFVFADFTLG